MKNTLSTLNIALLAVLLVGCATEETDLETSFCNLLANEEPVSVNTSESVPPEARQGDKPVLIILQQTGSDYSGRVTFTPDEPGNFTIGIDKEVPIRVTDAEGTEVEFLATVSSASCSELSVRHTVALELKSYLIDFGPTDSETITIVSEESNDDL